MQVRLIFPEKRWVHESMLRSWYRDLVEDGIIEEYTHGVEAPLDVVLEALTDGGYITHTGETRDDPKEV